MSPKEGGVDEEEEVGWRYEIRGGAEEEGWMNRNVYARHRKGGEEFRRR